MTKYTVTIEAPAIEDLDQAYQWIAERSPSSADTWFDGFIEALQPLESHPERCGLAAENDAVVPTIRQLLYGKRGGVYRVLFTIRGKEVHILHIRHAARRPMSSDEFTVGEPN